MGRVSVHINLHASHERGDKIDVGSTFLTDIGEAKAEVISVKLRIGLDTVVVFTDNIEDVDRLAFEFENLARSLREEHGWTAKENSK